MSNQKVNFKFIFLITASLSLVAIYLVLWIRVINDPAQRTGTDFIAFYAAGRIAQSQGYGNIYDLSKQKIEEESVLEFEILPEDVNPFVHPPFIVPILSLLAKFDYVTAFTLWAILLYSIYVICALITLQHLPHQEISDKTFLILGTLLFFPTFVSVLNGQDSALLLLGGILWSYGFTKKDDRLAGLGLALTTIRPHIALLLAIPFIFKQRRLWWWFVGAAALLVVFSLALLGFSGTQSFLSILTVSASGEGYKINESAMVNIIGLLNRAIPILNQETIRVTGWGIYLMALLGLNLLWIKSPEIREAHIGTAVIISLLAAPHLHYHDLTVLLVPLFLALRIGLTRKLIAADTAAILPLSVALLFLVANLAPALKYTIHYLFMVILLIAFWKPEIIRLPNTPRKNSTFDSKL